MRTPLSLSQFYSSVRELVEPTTIMVQGKVLGTYYPTGTEPIVQEVVKEVVKAPKKVEPAATPPLPVHPDVASARVQRQLDQAAAQRTRMAAEQAQRDAWLRRTQTKKDR